MSLRSQLSGWLWAKVLKAVYYTVEVHNFDLQEKTAKNNNNTITAKWVKPKIVIELTNCTGSLNTKRDVLNAY